MEGRDATERKPSQHGETQHVVKGPLRRAQQSTVVFCIHIVQSFGIRQSNLEGTNKSNMIKFKAKKCQSRFNYF
jgi:hypothetical protein